MRIGNGWIKEVKERGWKNRLGGERGKKWKTK